jgi:hypothetical protein
MALKTAYILRRPVVEIRFGSVCCACVDLWEHTVAVTWQIRRVEANTSCCCEGLLAPLTNTVQGGRRGALWMFTRRGRRR